MKIKILNLLIISILFIGCNDDAFLNRAPIDFLSPEEFKTERDIREAVNGVYSALIADKEEPLWTDFIVDNGYYVGYEAMWNGSFNSETDHVLRKWGRNYRIILRANTVLHYIDQVEMDEAVYNQYKGEAMFLRAYAYFDLAEFYGDVPLRLMPESLEEADKPLTPKSQVLDFIYEELQEAAELLPDVYDSRDRGRATKGAAWGILARAYLFNEEYELAIEYCQKVKDLGIYSLMDDYGHLFLMEFESVNTETIFDMQYEFNARELGLSNNWYTYFVSWSGYQLLKNLEEEFYTINGKSIKDPTNDMYVTTVNPQIYNKAFIEAGGYDNRFTNRDPRLHYTMIVPYTFLRPERETGTFVVYIPNAQKNANFTSFRVRKYVDHTDDYINNISGVNPIILRYADILLMEAEAWIELGDYDDTYVRSLINEVRQRPSVMMPKVEDAEGVNLGQNAMRDILRHERRVELAIEGLRFFDIKRWDIGAEAYSDAYGYRPDGLITNRANYQLYVYKTRSFDPAKGYLWPIPKAETDSNKAIKNQD